MHPQAPRRTTHAYGTPANRLVYDRWGRFGRPVVLLHGLLYDRTMWWPVAAELSHTRSSVIAVDLPGHGESAPRGDYALGTLAADLATLINRLDLHRAPVLVGHGESALLAEAFAARYATKAVLTVGEPMGAAAPSVAPHLATTGRNAVPEHYRQFAVPRADVGLLHAYRCWFADRPRPAAEPSRCGFPHLAAPASFAGNLTTLL